MNRIKVTRFFQRLGGGKSIKINVGEYDERDKRLHGLGAYLVENGYAETIKGVTSQIEPTPPHPDYDNMSIATIRQLVTEAGGNVDEIEDGRVSWQENKTLLIEWLEENV